MWLPPAYKAEKGAKDVGYGVYGTYDLGEFDQKGTVATKYGTRAEYEAAIEALHANGIQALADIVLNQRLGADGAEDVVAREVQSSNREVILGEPQTISAWTRFTFPGRDGASSDFAWDWTCFHGVDRDDRDGGEKRMFVGAGHAGETWACVIGEQDDVVVDAEGWATFRTLGGRLAVYLPGRCADALKHIDRELHAIVREIAEDTEELRA